MITSNRKINVFSFLFIDILVIAISVVSSFLLRYEFNFIIVANSPLFKVFGTLLFAKIIFFYYFGLYKGMWRYTSINDLINISKASSLGSLLGLSIYALGFGLSSIPKSVLFIDFIICTVLLSTTRVMVRFYYSNYVAKNNMKDKFSLRTKRKNIIIIGAGSSSEKIIREIINSIMCN